MDIQLKQTNFILCILIKTILTKNCQYFAKIKKRTMHDHKKDKND